MTTLGGNDSSQTTPTKGRSWQEIAAEAQSHRDATIKSNLIEPPVPEVPENMPQDVTHLPRQLISKEEADITELLPEKLLEHLAEGSLTSTAVTKAFLRRAGLAQRLANCVTELLPQRALERAAELDAYIKEHGKPVGPLHGLPISVKEHISFKGLRLSYGYVSHWNDRGIEDAHPLRILYDAGAVFYVRTTEPQTIMHLETSNNLYGVTVNPYNSNLSSGGSSGGEGALVALRGSCLGIGTDIGGSIRSPAGNCGVFGFRPTANRFPYEGVESTAIGVGGIMPVQGPLSTSLKGIQIYARAMLDAKPWIEENSLMPLPYREYPKIKDGDRLKIGVMWHDDVVKPHPPVTRALHEMVSKLRDQPGIEIFDFQAYRHDLGWDIIASLYFADGGENEAHEIDESGEPWRPLTRWLLKEEGHVSSLSMKGLWQWQTRREEYQKEYNKRWLATGSGNESRVMDAILMPYFPGASSRLDTAKYWPYTSTWNLLDYPSLIFPVTKVDPALDKVETDFKPMTERDEWNHKLYDPEVFKGAPVSLQLVTRRFEDEKLLGIAEYILGKLDLS